jgi:hypothetical protein
VHELRAQQAAGKARTVEVGKKGGANVYRRGDGSYVLGSSKPNGPNGGRSFQTISKAEGKRIEFGKSSRKHRAGDALRAGAIGGGIYGMERYKKKHEGN